jgi:hypothetical protein
MWLFLTFGEVVLMRSCSISDVTMLRSIAHRWDDVRPSFRYGIVLWGQEANLSLLWPCIGGPSLLRGEQRPCCTAQENDR